jgi:hypothetical protein
MWFVAGPAVGFQRRLKVMACRASRQEANKIAHSAFPIAATAR